MSKKRIKAVNLLKVLVGSRAHGLANEKSDYDYKSVYVLPTSDIVSLGYKYKGNDWVEGSTDNVAYELGHFLQLATKCNPTILEVFKAPVIEATEDGYKLRALFPYVWNPKGAFDAFVGYGLNQRKKFLDKKDNRQNKYAAAYIRTLYNLIDLLKKKDFEVNVGNKWLIGDILDEYKKGIYTTGDVINCAETMIEEAKYCLNECINEKDADTSLADIEKVNQFLIEMRKKYWTIGE